MSIMWFDSRGLPLSAIPLCSCIHVIFGHPGPCIPSNCMSQAVLTAALECSTCPYQRSLLSFRMRSRSLPCHSAAEIGGLALSKAKSHWLGALCYAHKSCTHELYTRPHVLKERWWEERTGSSSLNFFQAVLSHVVVESSQPTAAESTSLR